MGGKGSVSRFLKRRALRRASLAARRAFYKWQFNASHNYTVDEI
jgi:hypothetical protein